MVAGSVFVSIRNSFVEEGGRGVFFLHSYLYQHVGWAGGRYGVGGDGCIYIVTRRGRKLGGVLYISSWLIYIIRKLIVGGGR